MNLGMLRYHAFINFHFLEFLHSVKAIFVSLSNYHVDPTNTLYLSRSDNMFFTVKTDILEHQHMPAQSEL